MSGPGFAIGTGIPVRTPSAASPQQREQLRAAAQQFEAVFLRQMIGSMRQAHLAEDVFGSSATEQFTEMSDANMADHMAQNSNLGISEMLFRQLEGRMARR